MRKFLALTFAIALVQAPVIAQDEDPVRKATPDEYKKLGNQYLGPVSMTGKGVTFRYDDSQYKADIQKAEAIPNPALKQAAMKQVEARYASMKLMFNKEFELEFTTKMPVLRQTKMPGVEFDDKGFPKAGVAPKIKAGNGWVYNARPEDFNGAGKTLLIFGAARNGRPTVASATVDNGK